MHTDTHTTTTTTNTHTTHTHTRTNTHTQPHSISFPHSHASFPAPSQTVWGRQPDWRGTYCWSWPGRWWRSRVCSHSGPVGCSCCAPCRARPEDARFQSGTRWWWCWMPWSCWGSPAVPCSPGCCLWRWQAPEAHREGISCLDCAFYCYCCCCFCFVCVCVCVSVCVWVCVCVCVCVHACVCACVYLVLLFPLQEIQVTLPG